MRNAIGLWAALTLLACDPGMVGGGDDEELALGEGAPEGERDLFNVAECETGDFLPFRGDLHSHTGYSDGAEGSTPAEAFAFAEKKSNLDFLAVTDHGSKLGSAEYATCKAAADAATGGGFVAICGVEINAGDNSHANLLFSPSVFQNASSIPGIYAKLEKCEGCVGQINHPASDRFPWVDLRRDRDADAKLHQIEFNGGPWDESLATYVKALDRGWRVGPSWDSDTHKANWGAESQRTVLFAKSLTRAELRQALGHHRVCASNDRNATLVLRADQCFMGSSPRGRTSATLRVEASDLNAGDGFKSITLLGRGGKKLGTFDCHGKTVCTGSKKLSITPPTYVFAVATQEDGDHVVTAPVWFRP